MERIVIKPIGVVHSPYTETTGMPIQGIFEKTTKACIELKYQFARGLKGLDGFSYAYILYYFHKSQAEHIQARPFLESVNRGIFAIRGPHRPNHIGLSVVKIERIEDNKLYFSQVDMLDGTPVLDIKPYVKYFDYRDDAKCGWLDKHFKDGNVPNGTIRQ